jgi:hemerythrin superfamily protein
MAAPQEPDPDLVDVLIAEHREVESLLADIETTSGAVRRESLLAAIECLKRHSVTEERYLYPATREHLEAGEVLAQHEMREHAEADDKMHRIAHLAESDPAYEPLVHEFLTDVRDHVQEEEIELFPRLRAACDPEELRRLGSDAATPRASRGEPRQFSVDRRNVG